METEPVVKEPQAEPPAQQNPYGRKRSEAKSAEELLAGMNRQMPFSDENEKGMLSSLLQDPAERITETRLVIPPEAFYHEANRTIYVMLLEFSDKGLPIDPVLITNALRDQGLLERVGGPSAITELFTFVPSPSHYLHYQRIVRDKWLLRQMIHASAQNIEDAQEHGKEEVDAEVGKVLAKGEERMFKLLDTFQSKTGGAQLTTSSVAMGQWVEAFERICANRGQPLGVQTGWVDVDRAFHGLASDADGDFFLLGGYPGMGKTGAAVSLLENIAIEQRIPTAMFPMEMGVVGFSHRLVLGRAKVDVSVSRNGFIKKDEYAPIARAQDEIAKAPIHWDNSSFLETDELRAKVMMLHRRHGIKVFIFDHFGQIKPSSKEGKKDKLIGQIEVCETIHELRRGLGVLIILLIQLDKAGREKQQRNRPPGPGDVRGASELVEYPTQIAFIHRPDEIVKWGQMDEDRQNEWAGLTEHYQRDFPEAWHDGKGLPADSSMARMNWEEHARLIIAKNRWGPTTDDIVLRYRKNFQRFVGRTLKLYSNNEKFRQVKLPGF
jgi:replicative DNA helicase